MAALVAEIVRVECGGDNKKFMGVAGIDNSHFSRIGSAKSALGAPSVLALSWAYPGRADALWEAFCAQPDIADRLSRSSVQRPGKVVPWIARASSALDVEKAEALKRIASLLQEIPTGDGKWVGYALGAFVGIAEKARPLQAPATG